MSKLRIAVLRGGPSFHYDQSLKTGAYVLKNMPERFHAHDIFISKDGKWHRDGLERSPERALTNIDAVFNALHGEYGEDGKVQKILDTLAIPYTGTGSMGSAMGMNKLLSKKAFEHHKIKSPYYTTIRKGDDIDEKVKYLFHNFLLPIVVKPATSSVSVGIALVQKFPDLAEALEKALIYSDTVIVEEYVRGKEATCTVINHFRGEPIYATIPVEIRHPKEGYFEDYHSGYHEKIEHHVPGRFTDEEKKEVQRLAKLLHGQLGLRHYSHTDFVVTPRRGIFVLEVNTHPKLTPDSVHHKSLESIGCTPTDFINHIITLAIERK